MRQSRIGQALGTAMIVSIGTGAHAQNSSWTGFYAGPEAGAANARLRVSGTEVIEQLTNLRVGPNGTGTVVVVPGTFRTFDDSARRTSLLYGGFAGVQWQTGMFVLGAEADLHAGRDAARFAADFGIPATRLAPASTVTVTREAHQRFDWSARARAGFVAGSSTLLYGTGGIAQTRVRFVGADSFQTPAGPAAPGSAPGDPIFQSPAIGPVVITAAERATMTGWTAGIGAERRISRHLDAGIAARYTDYGTRSFALAEGCIPFQVATGQCAVNATTTLSAAPFDIPGRGTATYTDTNFALPGAIPGDTRMSLTEWRLALRLAWRF